MTYKKTLFFIGKCLTINHEQHNKEIVETALKSNTIDWDSVVKVSTSHFVFPALYCSLKKADFLHYLPQDLVDYMKHITDLNRERNQQIITQAKEINELLLENDITPIFLKGTGNLLEGLYDDVAERMVGDIDFLVSKEEYDNTINVLSKNEYKGLSDNKHKFRHTRHYSRIIKKGRIAAVEIHDELITEKYFDSFNYDYISKHPFNVTDNIFTLNLKDQICLSIISKQINDCGYLYKQIALRNSYDIFLLSKKASAKEAITGLKRISQLMNFYLAITFMVFGKPKSLKYHSNLKTDNYINKFKKYLDKNPRFRNKSLKFFLYIKNKMNIYIKVIVNRDMRNWFIEKLRSKNWQKKKLIQFGLKKPKPNA